METISIEMHCIDQEDLTKHLEERKQHLESLRLEIKQIDVKIIVDGTRSFLIRFNR